MIDANVHQGVGKVFRARTHEVLFVNDAFLPKTPDPEIDAFARKEGWIIVSHDKEFLKKIQQPRFNFLDSIETGYGRIMLSGRESQQVERVDEICDLIEALYECAHHSSRRFVVTVGPNWIRFDDQALNRSS
ncbi:MAG: DUF5615 family PIN-like protein [Thermomicrobiales bacterium]